MQNIYKYFPIKDAHIHNNIKQRVKTLEEEDSTIWYLDLKEFYKIMETTSDFEIYGYYLEGGYDLETYKEINQLRDLLYFDGKTIIFTSEGIFSNVNLYPSYLEAKKGK